MPSYILQQESKNEILTVVQYIVYSPTFRVPAFYFLIYDQAGTPLGLEEVVSTSLFKPSTLSRTTVHETHIDLGNSHLDPTASVFPLLSQGDHPVLQTRCWYFHPCETERAVKELLKERQDGGDTMGLEQWLEIWLVVLSSVVNMEEE
ncbi:hypothetical protein M408DRAFT_61273 [Serendipita vermifera MAFF 305830]|uniref:Ubiquitin-like-conjugating enzyme ATG10 n=1 Tax=Serendipita vermifera MAFF 305830 TaxID=933852 RepID=A0A0C3BN70_SERVB|nr:hypothetical protein M408DRAFT_61273 [Serendipita vermifera MAFF 305830]